MALSHTGRMQTGLFNDEFRTIAAIDQIVIYFRLDIDASARYSAAVFWRWALQPDGSSLTRHIDHPVDCIEMAARFLE